MKIRMVRHIPVNGAMPIYYCLKSEVPIILRLQYESRTFLCYQSILFPFIFVDSESVEMVVTHDDFLCRMESVIVCKGGYWYMSP